VRGDLRDLDSGMMAKHCFLSRPNASLVKNVEVFPRQCSAIPATRGSSPEIRRGAVKVKVWLGPRHAFGMNRHAREVPTAVRLARHSEYLWESSAPPTRA